MSNDFARSGWRRVAGPAILAWARAARGTAEQAVQASTEAWRCGGTWFVGLDALPNDPSGAVGGAAFPWAEAGLDPVALHPAQLSVVRAGYPQPSPAETEAAFRYRLTRDAAHLDGLIAEGAGKRRRIAEPHRWILGMALNAADDTAAPLTLWEGSHLIMQARLRAALSDVPPQDRGQADITDAYQSARKEVFATCRRITLPGRVGEAVVLHRLCLHGVAPWQDGATADPPGRMVAYFRPLMDSVTDWLDHA